MVRVDDTIADLEKRLKTIEAEVQRIITTVVAELEDEEKKIKAAINSLCAIVGKPQKYEEIAIEQHQTSQTRPDQYRDKRPSVVAEEILKKWQGTGIASATLYQLFEEFLRGGFIFKNKTDKGIQKRSIAVAMARKEAKFIHNLDNDTWSLK